MKFNVRALKIFVALGLMAFLFVKIDIAESFGFFIHLDLIDVAVILLVTFWLIFVSVLKWQVFLKSLGLGNSFWNLYRIYIVGYFFNNFLPSNIGGDIVRLTLTAKGNETYTSSFVAVFMERFTGIVATLLFVSVSLPFALRKYEFFEKKALVLFPTFVILIFLVLLFWIRPSSFDRWMPTKKLGKEICKKIKEILASIQSFRDRKQILLETMLLSIGFNFLAILNVYVVANALNLHANLLDLCILVPMILLISSIPLSVNAIGIAEGAYVLCLSLIGLSVSEALSIALLMRAKTLAVSLFGGLLFLGIKRENEIKSLRKTKEKTNHSIT